MKHQKTKIPIITGPTATGKTRIAVDLAKQINGEIISADSRQVYRHMDIGSGKDLGEYGETPYHLVDILDPGREFSVSDFQYQAKQAIKDIILKGKIPIICGGTTYYIKALVEDYPFGDKATDLNFTNFLEKKPREELINMMGSLNITDHALLKNESKRRMARVIEKATSSKKWLPQNQFCFADLYESRIYYLEIEREIVRNRIRQRLEQRLESGMIEEVRKLIDVHNVTHERLERYGLEYKWISLYLQGKVTMVDMKEKLFTAIARFAKRQMTFLRYMEKSGHSLIGISNFETLWEDFKSWRQR